MENKLRMLFEYQRYEKNEKLSALIDESDVRFAERLAEEDLRMAAGGVNTESDLTRSDVFKKC